MKFSLPAISPVLWFCLISCGCLWGTPLQAQEEASQPAASSEQDPKAKAAALEHAQRGQAFLKQKNWKDAIAEFEKAIELQPQSSALHYLLGVSYLEDTQASKSWIEMRKAVVLDSKNKNATRDFLKFWGYFDRKGILNVGTPEVESLKLLGKPDQQRDQAGETHLIYGFMWLNFRGGRLYAVVDTRGLSPEYAKALKTMEFRLGPPWREGYRLMNATNALTEYVTTGETVQKYQQLFSTQRLFKLGEQLSAKEMMTRMKALVEKSYQIEEWNVIQEGDDDILYEWRVAQSDKTPAQHEMIRMVRGKRDMHRLAYVTRKLPLTEEDRSQWIERLKSAKLVEAHPKASRLTAAQKKNLEEQLIKKSREIIALQLQYIQKGDVAAMKPFFTKRVRKRITAESLEMAKQLAASATPEELIHSLQIEGSGDQIRAKIKMKNGRTLTTLVPVEGKWEADTVWFK
ncbi:tetratricopeptide repeat protein [uncultured Gimesia sp.]|uniref:tetratricopeptide repeat protein n=1 Tax=uncultured Gimesia sp. TaxID=1678688 RepID=UPI0030DD928D|tara:strand:- start:373211 stop:374587 length:1377 start_codon:yes stop_codon:yes gene_type:complete